MKNKTRVNAYTHFWRNLQRRQRTRDRKIGLEKAIELAAKDTELQTKFAVRKKSATNHGMKYLKKRVVGLIKAGEFVAEKLGQTTPAKVEHYVGLALRTGGVNSRLSKIIAKRYMSRAKGGS